MCSNPSLLRVTEFQHIPVFVDTFKSEGGKLLYSRVYICFQFWNFSNGLFLEINRKVFFPYGSITSQLDFANKTKIPFRPPAPIFPLHYRVLLLVV